MRSMFAQVEHHKTTFLCRRVGQERQWEHSVVTMSLLRRHC
jgi:hypothetical protein